MTENSELVKPVISLYWKVYRLVFVVFSLYYIGIMLHSWDGLRYYGTLSDFLPGISLVLILWSVLALTVAALICLLFKAIEFVCLRAGRKINIDHMLMFFLVLLILGFPWNSSLLLWKLISPSKEVQDYGVSKLLETSKLYVRRPASRSFPPNDSFNELKGPFTTAPKGGLILFFLKRALYEAGVKEEMPIYEGNIHGSIKITHGAPDAPLPENKDILVIDMKPLTAMDKYRMDR